MNWQRGFDRLARVLLALVWAGWLVIAIFGHDSAGEVGSQFGYMLIFTGVYMGLYMALKWVARGFFSRD